MGTYCCQSSLANILPAIHMNHRERPVRFEVGTFCREECLVKSGTMKSYSDTSSERMSCTNLQVGRIGYFSGESTDEKAVFGGRFRRGGCNVIYCLQAGWIHKRSTSRGDKSFFG